MRVKKSFLVHLYADSEAPLRLCGDLEAIRDRTVYRFKSPAELLEILFRFTSEPPEAAELVGHMHVIEGREREAPVMPEAQDRPKDAGEEIQEDRGSPDGRRP